jgi:hypothetical protein
MPKIPSMQEFRKRQLMKLIRKRNRPVALFNDHLVSDRAKDIQDEILKLGITA